MSVPKCPSCHQSEVAIVGGQCAVCRTCSKTTRRVFHFCWACQREWPRDAPTTGSCILPNCALRAALLSDTKITDPTSSVVGCPYFRACPGCKALLTHNGRGCPNIVCPHCSTHFCFRCLRRRCLGRHTEGLRIMGFGLHYTQIIDTSPCRVVDNMESLTVLGLQ